MTYEVRAGTSICDSAARASRHATASSALGMNAREDQQDVGGEVGEDHGAHEPDAAGDAHGDERGERREDAGPEEHGAAHGDRQAEALLEPEHERAR